MLPIKILELSPKQVEYINNATHRWNFKVGATQCGKTFIDAQYIIPQRIIERRKMTGLCLILGVTRESIDRNVLEPMRDIWGNRMVSPINSRNLATIFGEKVYCLGDEKISQVSKIRGAKFKYVYIDEAVDMSEEVFEMLKSRLSLEYSCCDATGNPSYPSHFIKKFMDSGADVYSQSWTLYDNPFLPANYVKSLEIEYSGTVYFDRYILGKWTQAEGLIYPMYPDAFSEAPEGPYDEVTLSMDYGTQNACAGLLWVRKGSRRHALKEYRYSGRDTGHQKTDSEYADDIEDFVSGFVPEGGVTVVLDPSAASFKAELRKRSIFKVRDADNDVLNGIRDTATCLKSGKVTIDNSCIELKKEIEGYVWEKGDGTERPVKENDHLMDAMRYYVKTMRVAKSEGGQFGSYSIFSKR